VLHWSASLNTPQTVRTPFSHTSYDKRQILRWMDSALLMLHLPEVYPALERRGVGGAMSLVWYSANNQVERAVALDALAKDIKVEPTVLRTAGWQLADDKQQ
jgi:hypothetical protein